jgi:hypothetical protein
MMDRLALLASLWKQDNLVYTTKSAIVEWLIHEKEVAPYSNLPDTTILSDGLDLITMFLRSYFEKYAGNLKAGDLRGKWIKWTNENTSDKENELILVLWLIVGFLMLNLNNNFKYHNSLTSLLMVEGIQQKLPKNFYDPLVENLVEEKSFTEQVKAISQALAMVNNPLVIMELKRNSIEGMKAPITAILINHDALQPKHLLSKSPHPIVTI